MRVQSRGTNEFKQSYYWSKALKLVPRPLDEGSRPKKVANQGLNLHGTCFGGKIKIGSDPKRVQKRRARDLENKESGSGPRCTSFQALELTN